MFRERIIILIIFISSVARTQQSGHMIGAPSKAHMMGPGSCGEMMVWSRITSSCIVLPIKDMPMGMWMIHGNGFLVQDFEEGARGRNRLSSPNMLMNEIGHSYGNHYLDVNLMLTAEKWTFPKEGYPELLQIGERNEDDEPYIDAQHPHSSPIMGLTFSDTMRLGHGNDYVRVFFAPRGQATEGPIAFMHRQTGMVNPDAPLGHHIGQDVSHITSTVLGASLNIDRVGIEGSTFNGTEPEPAAVDLPMGTMNSYGTRLSYEFSDQWFAMVSAAEVKDPEPHDPDLKKIWRYSGSLYSKHRLNQDWNLDNSIIYGHVNFYDHVPVLRSVLEELWFHQDGLPHQFWGRIEFVERTGSQLAITDISGPNDPQWVTALTAGYTYKLNLVDGLEGGIGGAITKDILPADFRDAYSGDPLSAKIFLQLTGMKMGNF